MGPAFGFLPVSCGCQENKSLPPAYHFVITVLERQRKTPNPQTPAVKGRCCRTPLCDCCPFQAGTEAVGWPHLGAPGLRVE